MKNLFIISLLLVNHYVLCQNIEVQTFGNKEGKPIIFLHGGPGYNSVSFEKSTAQELAKKGFYVISYDRRGEGRNKKLKSEFTFNQTFEDLNGIYKSYNLKKASLIGHSFGGVVATLFSEKYPNKVNSLILVGTPISLQETFKNIISKSKEIYLKKGDKVNLNYLNMLDKMDTKSLEYSNYCFMHAMYNGFYTAKKLNQKAINLYKKVKADSLFVKYGSKMEYLAPQKFYKNEQYTSISLEENLKNLKSKNLKIYALYGKEDELYSKEQVDKLKNILGGDRVNYLDNCSHNVFIDRQEIFLELLDKWTK